MNSKFDEQYARLNQDQKKAVDTIDGPVLVIAGPGTGKTQVLSLRIANILKQTDTNPSSILCLTFQDASVIAMKNRLQSFIGYDAFKVQIHTFHSFCSEIIRSFPYEFDFSGDVEAIKEVDKLGIFKEILTENKLISLQQRNDVLGNFKSIVGAISNLKKEFITPQKLQFAIQNYEQSFEEKEKKLNARKIEKMRDLQIFYVKYLELMKERNLIDFDDMIFKVTEAFSIKDDLVKYFQEQYLYTLVDEFQDTNSAQLEVIKSVGSFESLSANVFAVGDDDQTIFRFQGASSDNFEKFLNIFPDTEIIVLHTNYRSKQGIIDSAASVIENNPNRVSSLEYFKNLGLNKEFVAHEQIINDQLLITRQAKLGENYTRKLGLKTGSLANSQTFNSLTVSVHNFEHSFHEDYWIGKKIKDLVEQGTKLNEIALISRTNRQIVNITKFLDRFQIPYLIRRSESILDNKYIQNIIQIFRIIDDPVLLKRDEIMWQVLSQDFIGMNSFDVFALVHDAREQKVSMYDFLTNSKFQIPSNKQVSSGGVVENPPLSASQPFPSREGILSDGKPANLDTESLEKYQAVLTFLNKIIALQQYAMNNSFLNLFTKVVHTFNLIKYLETLDNSYAEINRLSSLFQFASTRSKSDKNYNLKRFLEEVKLMREKNISLGSDPIDIDAENKINILTAHSSKGLEFDHVFIYQTIENKWEKNSGGRDGISLPPFNLADDGWQVADGKEAAKIRKELEKFEEEIDERRLFYVAMTRAKKSLTLTYSKKYYDSDSGEVDMNEKLMSKFVAESQIVDILSHSELLAEHAEIMKLMLADEEPIKVPQKNQDYLQRLVDKELYLSATKLNKYQSCHYKFLLEDIFKLPTSKSLNLEIGTAIHKGIEILTKSYALNVVGDDVGAGLRPPPTSGMVDCEKILQSAREQFDRNIDTDQINTEELFSIDVAYQEIERGLRAYYDYFVLNPDKPKETEFMSVGIFEGIKLRGRIDKVGSASHTEEQLVITDYKTTSTTPSITEFLGLTKAGEDKKHLRQLLFYRLLLEHADSLKGKSIAGKLSTLKIEYINTKDGEVKVFEIPVRGIYEFLPRSNSKKTAEFDLDNEFSVFKEELRESFESIKELKFERTTNRKICQFCSFKNHCGR